MRNNPERLEPLYCKPLVYQLLSILFCAVFFFGYLAWTPAGIFAMPFSQSDAVEDDVANDELTEDERAKDIASLRTEGDRLIAHGIMLLETESGADDWEEAAADFQSALQLYRSIERRDLEASAWQQMGQAYSRLQQNGRALNAYNNALVVAVEIADVQRESKALFGIGVVQHAIGLSFQQQEQVARSQESFALAVDAYTTVDTLAQEIGNVELSARALNNLGRLYVEQEKSDLGFQAYESASALATSLTDRDLVAQITGRVEKKVLARFFPAFAA